MKVVIRFRYTICAKRLIASGIITPTTHNLTVSISNVPDQRWSKDERDPSVLWQAENEFLKKVRKTHLESVLVEWESFDTEAKMLSRYWFNHLAMR